MDKSTHAELLARAKSDGRTLSNFIETVLKKEFEKDQKRK